MPDQPDKLTAKQRGALHLYCELLADALNSAGLDMKKTLKPEIDIPWTKDSVKRHLWKPILEAMTSKESTEDMDTIDPSSVYETLNRHLCEKFGVHVEWPSLETQYKKQGEI